MSTNIMREIRLILVCVLCTGTFFPAAQALAQLHNAGQETWDLTLNHYQPLKTLGYTTIPIVTASHHDTGATAVADAGSGRTLEGLIEGFSRLTRMEVYHGGILALDSPQLVNYPVIAVEGNVSDVSEQEILTIRRYIDNGGFVVLGEGIPKRQKALLGKGISIRRIPQDHPIYDCFFTFNGHSGSAAPVYMGIWKGDSLVGICSQPLFRQWSQPFNMIPDVGMKMSVNIVVYGLIRGLD